MRYTRDTLRDAAWKKPRESAATATPEERADVVLAKIPAFDEEELSDKFNSEVIAPNLEELRGLISVAKSELFAYNGLIDAEESADPQKAKNAVSFVEEAGLRLIAQMSQFFTDARKAQLDVVIPDEALKAEVPKTFTREMPIEQFSNLVSKLELPVLKLARRHLSKELAFSEIPAIPDAPEDIIAEIIIALNLYVGEADRTARAALKAELMAQFAAEEKAEKEGKAMNALDRQINIIQTAFLTCEENPSIPWEPKGARLLILAAMRTFAHVSGMTLKENSNENLEEIMRHIRFNHEDIAEHKKASELAARYNKDGLRDTQVGLVRCAEAASKMAELRKKMLEDVLSTVLIAVKNFNLEDFFEGDLSDDEKLTHTKNAITTAIYIKFSEAINAQFQEEISKINVFDIENIVAEVVSRVKDRWRNLQEEFVEVEPYYEDEDDEDEDDSGESTLGGEIAAEDVVDEASASPSVSAAWTRSALKVIARTNISDVARPIARRTVSVASPSALARPVAAKPETSTAEAVTAPASVPRIATPVPVVVPATFTPTINLPTPSVIIKFEPEVTSPWNKRAWLLGSFILSTGVAVTGAVGTLAAVNALSDKIAAENGADGLSAEPPAPATSIWTKLGNNTGRPIAFPASGDTAWVEALSSDGTIPDGTNAFIFECTNGAVSQTAGYPTYALPDDYWLAQYMTVNGFETFGALQNLERMCVAHQNGVFATVLTPNTVVEPAAVK